MTTDPILRKVVEIYMEHPEHDHAVRCGLTRAALAWATHHNEWPRGGHSFHPQTGIPMYDDNGMVCDQWRMAACQWCGRTRQQVRYGDDYQLLYDGDAPVTPPYCTKRPEWADLSIEQVISKEVKRFAALMERAAPLIEREQRKGPLTGERLAYIHQTHGISPDVVSDITLLVFDAGIMAEYEAAYDQHRDTGKAGLKRAVLVAKTAADSA